jgi:hypothetical protein
MAGIDFPRNIPKPNRMHTIREIVVVGTTMEDRWKGLHTPSSGHKSKGPDSTPEQLVFYRDMRFWLIVMMLIAFFAFTLIRFP